MPKKLLFSLVVGLFASPIYAQTTDNISSSISFSGGSSQYVNHSISLYNFTPELLKAAENCLPYSEDFVDANPQIDEGFSAFTELLIGDAAKDMKTQVLIDIKGREDNLCHFQVTYNTGFLGQSINDCRVDNEQLAEIVSAMKDRSAEPVTETFTTYSEVVTEDEDGPKTTKYPMQTTVTDSRFNVTLQKITASSCTTERKETSMEEQAETLQKIEEQDAFSPEFLTSLQQCQPDKAENRFMFTLQNIEIKGLENGLCHLVYNNFDIYAPQDTLGNLQKFGDMPDFLNDDQVQSQYIPQYDNEILDVLDYCRNKNQYSRSSSGSINKITHKMTIKTNYTDDVCQIDILHNVDINGVSKDYDIHCHLTDNQINEIIKPYEAELKSYYAEPFEYLREHRETLAEISQKVTDRFLHGEYCKSE